MVTYYVHDPANKQTNTNENVILAEVTMNLGCCLDTAHLLTSIDAVVFEVVLHWCSNGYIIIIINAD